MLTRSVLVAVVIGLLLPMPVEAEFTGMPSGFTDQAVVGGLGAPTAIDWLPDGTLLTATQGGILYRSSGDGSAQVMLNLSGNVCSSGEMGLLGLAVDPEYGAGSDFIYLYYTHEEVDGGCGSANTRANRVVRFPVERDGAVGAEEVLIDNILALGTNHNGGDLHFDTGGLLYVSVGDSGIDLQAGNPNAQRLDLLNGKILRITKSGNIPAGNPFQDPSTTTRCNYAGQDPENKGRTCQEIFATGLRNPFRIAINPNDQSFYINDVGGGAWEEIDVGASGANYGWPHREGPCPIGVTSDGCAEDTRFEEPIFAYRRDGRPGEFAGCRTLTGGAFVPAAAGWPNFDANDYLFADFACGRLFVHRGEAPGAPVEVFGAGIPFGDAIHLAFGPDSALYYTTFANCGQVRRIVSGPAPAPPLLPPCASPQPPPPPPPPTGNTPGPGEPIAPTTSDTNDTNDAKCTNEKKDKKGKNGKKGKKGKNDKKCKNDKNDRKGKKDKKDKNDRNHRKGKKDKKERKR